MDISLGFIIVITLVLFPGLLFRRLYFYGEFSKQFSSGQSITNQIILAVVPGVSLLISAFLIYHYFINQIQIEVIVEKFKQLNDPLIKYPKDNERIPLAQMFISKLGPFIGLLYLLSALIGITSGRLVRTLKLDRRFKLLRFKNYWFYILNGENFDFKKFKSLKQENKKLLFTKADILIEQNSENALFSGIVIDYELLNSDGITLSKLYLQYAERYGLSDNVKKRTRIPGDIFVVDCVNMKNINLTYIYEEQNDGNRKQINRILESKIPGNVALIYGTIFVAIIPLFLFKVESIEIEFYESIFQLSWYNKIAAYFFITQFLSLLNPFNKHGEKYKIVSFKLYILRIIGAVILYWAAFL